MGEQSGRVKNFSRRLDIIELVDHLCLTSEGIEISVICCGYADLVDKPEGIVVAEGHPSRSNGPISLQLQVIILAQDGSIRSVEIGDGHRNPTVICTTSDSEDACNIRRNSI